jgi:predicted HTH transcriptional regulator
MLEALRLFSENRTYDELPAPKGVINERAIEQAFAEIKKSPTKKHLETLNIVTEHIGKSIPTIGGVLLFGDNRLVLFPDAVIRCARFKGTTKEKIIDQKDILSFPPLAISEILAFIERNTQTEGRIEKIYRQDISEYPPFALREAIINAILHADYAMKGCHIQIAIFDDRIEFTNPGGLPFGQTIQKALSGFSKLRNRVIGRLFRELQLIEQWGSGLQRILSVCKKEGLKAPVIEEQNNHFRLTLYAKRIEQRQLSEWEEILMRHLQDHTSVTTKEAAQIWNVTDRTARTRLKGMVEVGMIQRIATAEKDPFARFVMKG